MKSDKDLGMDAKITRRDLLHDVGLTALGIGISTALPAAAASPINLGSSEGLQDSKSPVPDATNYPPIRTGLRGSHPGAYEAAHALAREGRAFPEPVDLDEEYDLVVVGAGISGLAAAHYYQDRFGRDSRILLLENHDDFGGHARRNEFHQGGKMRLSLGGTHNLEWWNFSKEVKRYLKRLGVDAKRMRKDMQFEYGRQAPNSPAMYFDKDTFGTDRLVAKSDLSAAGGLAEDRIDQFPLSETSKTALKNFYKRRDDVLPDMSRVEKEEYLRTISYPEFLRRYGALDEEAIFLFSKQLHGGWGVEMRAASVMEALEAGLPGQHLLGGDHSEDGWDYPAAMWPDGNASLVRLQVASLIPEVAPKADASNVAVTNFDYGKLDQAGENVRLRLNSTVIRAQDTDGGVYVSYLSNDKLLRLRAKHCVMACYHVIIPHLIPELPQAQKEAMKYQVKVPLVLTNVLLRNTEALDRLGIDSVDCPGRMLSSLFTFRGINTGGFSHDLKEEGPVSLVFWGMISPPKEAIDLQAQRRASRALMLGLSFEDYEREVRTVLDGLLGPAGFDVETDILAITVNRWPHGYAHEYLDLWDYDWEEGNAPHLTAQQPFGKITMANSDAGAYAYTHGAIDEAHRAVKQLPS
ncbi:MAG: FAD/NAD(P)-binding protein [Pseudomonadota bacterium]